MLPDACPCSGTRCADFDECALGLDARPEDAPCINVVGSFSCGECTSGRFADDDVGIACDANSTDSTASDSTDCVWNSGFLGGFRLHCV